MLKEQTTLHYRNGASDKVYQTTLEETNREYFVNYAYGRRGSSMQTGTKTATAVNLDAARAIYERLINEKKAKGYTPGEAGTPYAHTDKGNQNTGILPQLCNSIQCTEAQGLIKDPRWWMQPKHDGKRLLFQKKDGVITGINRKGLIVALPQTLRDDAERMPGDFLIDGEAIDHRLIAFDLLHNGGEDIRSKTYLERHLLLMHLLTMCELRRIQISTIACMDGEKRRMFDELEATGAEGVVFKQIDQPYTEGRPASSGDWLKFKFQETASFLVTRHNQQRSVSLVLLDDGVARNAGNITIPPNHVIPAVGAVVEVRYLYAFRESGHIYQPVYLGVREDITHEECTVEQLKWKQELVAAT